MGKYRPHSMTTSKIVLPNGTHIPTYIYKEYRPNTYMSLVKRGAILRMPVRLSAKKKEQLIQQFHEWIHEKTQHKPQLADRYASSSYRSGDTLQVGSRTYTLQFSETTNKHPSVQHYCSTGTLSFRLPSDMDEEDRTKAITHLLSRIIASHFLPDITRRVSELNAQYFQVPIGQVRLKYNHSNWGSCSSKGNINLSTRLLFAPQEVIDYVIIHELAHRIEMNHSRRFWALVADAMPDYKDQVKWLRQHGPACRF